MFFFTLQYDFETEVNGVMDKKGGFYFKSIDVLNILGYKKPAEAVRTHVPDAVSLDVLLSQNGNTMDVRVVPFPTNSKVLTPRQVFQLLQKIRRPNREFTEWFQNILRQPLVSNEEMDFLKKVNHDNHCVKPRFTLHPEGGIKLTSLFEELFSVKSELIEVKQEPMDVEVAEKRSIGINKGISNSCTVKFFGREQDVLLAERDVVQIEAQDFNGNHNPMKLFYKTRGQVIQYAPCGM